VQRCEDDLGIYWTVCISKLLYFLISAHSLAHIIDSIAASHIDILSLGPCSRLAFINYLARGSFMRIFFKNLILDLILKIAVIIL